MTALARARKGLLKRGWGRTLCAPLATDLLPDRWVFVVGCYNSGTTLLRDLLGRHPQIDALPSEGVRLTDALPRPEDEGWHRMWCRCVEQMRLSAGADQKERAARIRRHWSLALPRGTRNVLEKSIANAARLPFLQAHFPPAYVIHLVRNGYAVAEGIRRKGKPVGVGRDEVGDRYPIELCAEQWRTSLRQVEADRPQVERFHEVRYEDLAADASAELRRITDFLGLPPLATGAAAGEMSVHGVVSPVRDMNAESLARLSADDIEAIEGVAGPDLERCGYGHP